MFNYCHGPRPFVSLFLCCTVIGGVFDFVLIFISIHLLTGSSHLLSHSFMLIQNLFIFIMFIICGSEK